YMRSGVSNFDDFNSSVRSTYLNTRFGLVQPIDALYGYNATKSALKQAKLAYESSRKSLKRAELDLVYRVTQSFYNLLLVQ
ncbi:TolC family protein, partial [bacterium]|nr:TolC family protein [bacterium]